MKKFRSWHNLCSSYCNLTIINNEDQGKDISHEIIYQRMYVNWNASEQQRLRLR